MNNHIHKHYPPKKTYLLPREVAVYKHVWSLNNEEKAKLHFYKMMYTRNWATFTETVDGNNPNHDKDVVRYRGVDYDVEYLETSWNDIRKRRPSVLLASLRYHKWSKLAVALVRIAPATVTPENVEGAEELEL